ncbi:hypothetical protein [Modestobacter sp. SYSU DS0290]
MSEPDRLSRQSSWDGDPTPHGSSAWTGGRLPAQPLADQPTEVVHTEARWDPTPESSPATSWPPTAPVAVRQPADDAGGRPAVCRRPDTLAGLLLLLAGVAAGLSLLVVWVDGGDRGLVLVQRSLDDLAEGPGGLAGHLDWAVPAVAGGGAVLFLLGLLLFVPARTHRFLGALALVVALVVAAGVLVPLADADWDLERWAVGAWFAVAAAALGVLGGLKALVTGERTRW